MKKILLSAFIASLMFTSCCKKEEDPMPEVCPSQSASISTSPTGVFADISFIQSRMSSNPQLAKDVYDTFKDKLAVNVQNPTKATAIRTQLGDWISTINSSTATATNGSAGKLGKRYVNEKGFEPEQLVKKGLIGAYQLSNALKITFELLGDVDKAKQQELFDKFVTALIGSPAYLNASKGKINNHKKEITGYPEMAGNEFAKYLNTVSSNPAFSSLSDELYATLREAKGKIGNKGQLSESLKKARNLAAKVVAIRCVHYLLEVSEGYEKVGLTEKKAHGISEGLGFYYSLQFTYGGSATNHQPYVTSQKVEDLFNTLNLWDTAASKTKLETIAKELATTFKFSVDDAKK